MTDAELLAEVLEHRSDLTDVEIETFTDMQSQSGLSPKQRAWVQRVHERLVPQYENLVSSGRVPRGKEVPTPEVLKVLPLRPPPLKRNT